MTQLHPMLTGMLVEHILLAGLLLLLILEMLTRQRREPLLLTLGTVGLALGVSLWLALQGYSATPFAGEFSVDPAALIAKAILLGLSLPVILSLRGQGLDYRLAALLLSSLYGASLLLSADSLIMLFISLELMSLPLYALIVYGSTHVHRAQAALKYLILGSVGTASLLLGIAWLLGTTGSLSLSAFTQALNMDSLPAQTAALLVLLGLLLKAALVPFHTWAPDAYEAASAPLTAYMATVIKAALFFFIVRLFDQYALPGQWVSLIVLLALLSMAWGNLTAMRQTSFKRIIAYSSIAHAGYLLLVLLAVGEQWYGVIAFYLLVYGIATVLAFACLPQRKDGPLLDRLDALQGLFYQRPWAAVLIGVAMLSLAGLPPLPGFVAKFYIFQQLIAQGWVLYAVLGLGLSYLGLYFYLRVIQYLFMHPHDPQAPPLRRAYPTQQLAAALSLTALICVMLLPGFVMSWLNI
ncbi:NADH-quinone oxidoreductase subunit N [Thiorhodospira sibirica]|uniref:NADH-quinone oxidoreductase subunit N n=1 Tax=Thiorhodospira sibirica TaxID=154347 RepID=UPI00022C52CE|nr:NADH-quinone oxidoreductase subunit N [Thiorhodospira sibirica]